MNGRDSPVKTIKGSAFFIPTREHVEEFRYVDDVDNSEIIREAKARLMWGHSLTQSPSGCPFEEELARYEQALSKWAENSNLPRTQKRQAYGWVRRKLSSPHWSPADRLIEPATRSRRKKLKNRTRDERIADLQAALAKENK